MSTTLPQHAPEHVHQALQDAGVNPADLDVDQLLRATDRISTGGGVRGNALATYIIDGKGLSAQVDEAERARLAADAARKHETRSRAQKIAGNRPPPRRAKAQVAERAPLAPVLDVSVPVHQHITRYGDTVLDGATVTAGKTGRIIITLTDAAQARDLATFLAGEADRLTDETLIKKLRIVAGKATRLAERLA